MSIQAVGMSNGAYCAPKAKGVSFSGEEAPAKQSGNIGKAIASTFVTGLGQVCDGRTKTGLKQFGTGLGLEVLAGVLTSVGMSVKNKVGSTIALVGATAAGIGYVANKVISIVDAYKGGK